MHDEELHARARDGLLQGRGMVEQVVRQAITDGHIGPDRDPVLETNLLLALTGFTTLLELDAVTPSAALEAVESYLDRLFEAAGA
ncbi:TetR family transcriptional regulator C-terminal domain-containing protein [Streptomyces sp. C]|uniref:TetR family transcriptional regulator C-terminal domain-containing protein n=1 Tax=Streptomyces sp. C TaxID=253839 RepID=UPI0001B5870D|nr:TetR family transcriptional regulator C-terminal domain-containing protein [Streptomyces sp. C]